MDPSRVSIDTIDQTSLRLIYNKYREDELAIRLTIRPCQVARVSSNALFRFSSRKAHIIEPSIMRYFSTLVVEDWQA